MLHKRLMAALSAMFVGTLLAACFPPTPAPATLSENVTFTEEGGFITEPVPMELVRVPAGEFLMGSDPAKDPLAASDEEPQHVVTLPEFYIGKYEVTNAQFASFVEATGRDAPSNWENGQVPEGQEDHPVVWLTWDDAVAFTEWLAEETGTAFRLCTEAEWEKACRGTSGLLYPWGDTFEPAKASPWEGEISFNTAPVDSHSPSSDSPYGVAGMVGNAWEWVADRYDASYYARSPTENPLGSDSGDLRALRGGCVKRRDPCARCALRSGENPALRRSYNGLRVCISP